MLQHHGPCDLVVEPRRRAQSWSAVIRPKNRLYGFAFGAICRRTETWIASQAFHLFKGPGVAWIRHFRGRWSAKLISRSKRERLNRSPVSSKIKCQATDRIGAPMAHAPGSLIFAANSRIRNLGSISAAQRDKRFRGCNAQAAARFQFRGTSPYMDHV